MICPLRSIVVNKAFNLNLYLPGDIMHIELGRLVKNVSMVVGSLFDWRYFLLDCRVFYDGGKSVVVW